MKAFKIIVIIILLFFTTGCWNYRELNEMSIVGAIGIDYDQEKNMFNISAQILNPKKSSGGTSSGFFDESPIIVYQHSDKTIHEALRNMVYESPKKLYIGHMEAIIFGRTVAEKYMAESLDFLFRDSESRKDFDLLVAPDGEASEILKIIPPFETTISSSIMSIVKANTKYIGSISNTTFDNFISMVYQEGTEAVLPTIKIIRSKSGIGEELENITSTVSKSDLEIKELAVFKDSKMIGTLNEEESIGYNLVAGNIKQGVVSFYCDDEKNSASVELINLSSKTEVKIKDDIPNASVKISGMVTLSEVNCAIDVNKQKNLDKIKTMAEKELKKLAEDSITKAIQFNSDLFGFGEYLFRNDHKYWEKNKDKWYEIYPNIKYELEVDLKMPQKGSTVNSFKEKLDDTKK